MRCCLGSGVPSKHALDTRLDYGRHRPDQADGLHGYSQFLAAMGRIKEALAMREHLQPVEPFIINYTVDTAEIYWLDGATEKAVAMLEPFRPVGRSNSR